MDHVVVDGVKYVAKNVVSRVQMVRFFYVPASGAVSLLIYI